MVKATSVTRGEAAILDRLFELEDIARSLKGAHWLGCRTSAPPPEWRASP